MNSNPAEPATTPTAASAEPSEEQVQVLRALIKASVDVNNNGQIHMDEYTRLYLV